MVNRESAERQTRAGLLDPTSVGLRLLRRSFARPRATVADLRLRGSAFIVRCVSPQTAPENWPSFHYDLGGLFLSSKSP